jgi:ribonuclease BN (tRNA processing enzyme)
VKILVLGAGSLLHATRAMSSFVLDDSVLLDAPPSVTLSLRLAGVPPLGIRTVCISHFHGDHIGGLPFLLTEYDSVLHRRDPLQIVGPPGVRARVEEFYELMFPGALGWNTTYERTFVELDENGSFEADGMRVRARAVVHGDPALGFRLELDGQSVGYTGDTAWCDAILDLAAGADCLIADCTYPAGRGHPTHLGLGDIEELRAQLPDSTLIVLTHLGEDPDELPPGVVVPADGELLTLPTR